MTLRDSRIPSLLSVAALTLGCGEAGASQFLDATWFAHCDGVRDGIACSPRGQGNSVQGFAGSEVTGFCDLRDFGDETVFNFSARAGNGALLEIQNLRFRNDGFSVVGDDCNVSFVEDGVDYGTGIVSNTRGRCGPAVPSDIQPCQVVVDFVPQGESGIAMRTPYSGQIADTGPEVRVTVECLDVGNPSSPDAQRRSLGLAAGRENQPALLRGANCTELTP